MKKVLGMLLFTGCVGAGSPPPAESAPAGPQVILTPEVFRPLRAGCVDRVEDLPSSSLYQADDPRLRAPALIVVLKERRRLLRFENGVVRTGDRSDGQPDCWPVALGVLDDRTHPVGPKRQRGDRKTPEGWYRTSDKPASSFYHAMWISYPNAQDADIGLGNRKITQAQHDAITSADKAGRLPPQDTGLGGDLLIHGGSGEYDWTWGCVGMNDADIDTLRATLPRGMKAEMLILP